MSRREYDHKAIEQKWREIWEQTGLHEPDLGKPERPFYNLMMFPYPSAEGLHVGNMFAFTGVDAHGRFKRMQGHDVFEPIGLDGFGIHSENYALRVGRHPIDLAKKTEERFYGQLARIGAGFAWRERLETYDPEYYRWTQWLFVTLYKNGLVERKKAPVNWCPEDKTVLADEQVVDGRCERCGSVVERRELEQWFFKITKYAERLLENLEKLDWDPIVKTAQRNWIGRSEGAEVRFKTQDSRFEIPAFTTRPDTIFGATFLVLAPEHPLVDELTAEGQKEAVRKYREQVARESTAERERTDRPKTGVPLGATVRNPATGEEIPVWIADYVSLRYGTGAIMAVPAHDERDFAFAEKFGLEIRQVILATEPSSLVTPIPSRPIEPYSGSGIYRDSDFLDGKRTDEGVAATIEWLEREGYGKRAVSYRLHDWLISRQRYWGPPIPIIYCEKCGTVPVPEEDLPVLLPRVEEFRPTGTGASPLASVPEFYETTCPTCGGEARRETDVSDTFLDSSWYFLRYPSVEYEQGPFDPERIKAWLPVNAYIGGREHSVLHLLYSRFVTMALHDLGHLDFEEPFTKFRGHGLLVTKGAKISKSRGNLLTPDEYIDNHGADAFRVALLFMVPYQQGGELVLDHAIQGAVRFLTRVRRLVGEFTETPSAAGESEREALHESVLAAAASRATAKATDDIEHLRYNTAIATIMTYLNELVREREEFPFAGHTEDWRDSLKVLLQLLAPFAPFLTEELWHRLGAETSIHVSGWPETRGEMRMEAVTIPVQVDGKHRATLALSPEEAADEKTVTELALADHDVRRHLEGREVTRTVFVPGRTVSFVTKQG